MKLINFVFTKISAERFSPEMKQVKINTSINIDSIEENSDKKNLETMMTLSFNYTINYSENLATINLSGKILLLVESKKAKEILKKWKNKELDETLQEPIFNFILSKSNIKALQLEDELKLPPHFKLPSVKISENKQ